MAEYIEREALIKAIENDCLELVYYTKEDAIQCVKAIQAADVAPVRHGRWVEKEKYTFGIMYDCSLCENRILDNGHSWNYCPHCGAKMGADTQEREGGK